MFVPMLTNDKQFEGGRKEIDKNEIIRQKLSQARTSPLRTYIDLTVGDVSFARFLLYEFLTSLLGPLPGGVGFLLDRKSVV